jgi:tetratricopeptide (TPR) repeat protein
MTLKDQDNQNTKLAGNYLNGKSDWTLYEATFESGYVTKLILNFSGSGKAESKPNAIDELWIDDIKLENLSGDEMDRCDILKNSGTSIRDVNDNNRGLAFRFATNVADAQFVNGNEYVSGSGSMKLYNYDEAIEDINKAIKLYPTFGEAYFNRANLMAISGKFPEAYDDYTKAIELEPNLGEAYYNRGLVQIFMKDTRKGCMDLSKAGELGILGAYDVLKEFNIAIH